jgi:hypothetical protein
LHGVTEDPWGSPHKPRKERRGERGLPEVERNAAGIGGLQSCPCLWMERGGKGQEGLAKQATPISWKMAPVIKAVKASRKGAWDNREGAVGPSGSGKPHSQASLEAGSP